MKKPISHYYSFKEKTESVANLYVQTHEAPHRYLAYKDIPQIMSQLVQGKRALDYGSGTGASSSFLYNLGFEVIGIDISPQMLEEAKANFPLIPFHTIKDINFKYKFDLVFSSFVLFEMSSKDAIIDYLNSASKFLKDGGIFISITGSEDLYSLSRNWMTFEVNFPENERLVSGSIVKLALKNPYLEFYDYYWKKSDYIECFEKTDLEILKIHSPLGSIEDIYSWKDELVASPFTIFIARNKKI